jgi:hypothetical protein
MKSKSEIQNLEARKKSDNRKRKPAAPSPTQTTQSEDTASETVWLLSADFFRNADLEPQSSEESTSLKQFNSEF